MAVCWQGISEEVQQNYVGRVRRLRQQVPSRTKSHASISCENASRVPDVGDRLLRNFDDFL